MTLECDFRFGSKKSSGNSRPSRLGIVVVLSGQHVFERDGAYENQNENIFARTLSSIPQRETMCSLLSV